MPSIRIGYSSEFVLRNELVGIGSTATSSRLDVAGQIRSENTAGSGGVSTFREYQGFSQAEANITNNITIDNGSGGPYGSLTGEIKITGETTVSSGSTVEVGKTKTLTATDRFAVPLGETNNRDNAPEAGTTRFNQDFGTLEFFDGANWKTVNSYARPGGGGRGLFAGGSDPGGISTIQTVQISTRGNAEYFGDRSIAKALLAGFGNETRGVFAGGSTSGFSDVIDYVTTASSGNAIDFGNLLTAAGYIGGLASSTRGIMAGDYSGSPASESNVIQYVQIHTTGNAVDFGDLTLARLLQSSATASPTRGVMGGGWLPSNRSDIIDYVTIASTGNAIDFGTLTQIKSACPAGSTGTRAVWAGGYKNISPTLEHYKTVEYITIASGGNAIDFGERTFAGAYSGAASSHTRLVTCMGFTPANTNRMDSIEMATGGDAVDFGDAVTTANAPGGCSDSHGGLGGF
jgi:hypothetical protein